MAETLNLDAKHTALVLIDLQQGILQRKTAPHSASDVLARSARLAERFRAVGGLVVLVNVSYSPDGGDRLTQPTDDPPLASAFAPGWDQLSPELGRGAGDIAITKRQWGAFYGTPLDMQLRRRGIKTIVIAGIATNFGVESTARDAFERGYALVFVEDAMAGLSEGAHAFAISTIFPRLGRVRSTEEILNAIRA
ncbi:MAG TPA: hydrolase [Gemmatimonadaceae bacterium]|nr:hydrolase [Gemmatimonadaceae bacterium]